MIGTVRGWIDRNEETALREWLRRGGAAALPDAEKAEMASHAASTGRAGMLRALAEACNGLSLEPATDGRTLLHDAALSGDPDTMAFACRVLGFSPFDDDHRGVTPLELAASCGPEALAAMEALAGVRLADCCRNPILRGFYPDPSILRVGEDYYLINSSFVYVPALPVSHSRDLIHWELVGHVFTDPETAGLEGLPGGFGYWAPDISYDGRRFWVIATLRREDDPRRVQMITSAPTPAGPWDAPRFLPIDGIDPSIFTDSDGRRYVLTNPGAQLAPLSPEGELLAPPRMIYYGSNRHKSEGPHLVKKDGWYYLFQAEGGTGTGHMITCARSRELWGPYDPCPFNPILRTAPPERYIRRGGHGKPVQLPDGRWMIAYLCGRNVEGHSLMGRETALDPLEWTLDGWPMVNRLRWPSALQPKPLPDAPLGRTEPWICPREDPRRFCTETDGRLSIAGGQPLTERAGAHLLLHRQTEAAVRQAVQVDLADMAAGSEAGLTGYYDERSHYLFGLRKTADGATLFLREQIADEQKITTLARLPGTQATLTAEGRGLTRRLACPEAGVERVIEIRYLTDEGLGGGKRFTGAALGLAAVGTGGAIFTHYQEAMTDER